MATSSRPGRARVRSLTDDLRGRDDAALARLLCARPDLARPAPTDLAALAARAATRPSVRRALETLDRGRLQVLEALVASGAEGVDRARAADLLGVGARRLAPVVDELWALALLWGGAGDLHVVRAVAEALGPCVAGLAPSDRTRTEPERGAEAVLESVARLTPEARSVLDRLTWGPPTGTFDTRGPLGATVHDLVSGGLLRRTADGVQLPREVALALRGGRLHRALELDPPDVPGAPDASDASDAAARGARAARAATVAATSAGAASLLLERVDELAARWGAAPPRVLRSGGLAALDLRRLAGSLELAVEQAALLVEVVRAAGLVDDDGEVEPVWAPTHEYDEWQAAPAATRWTRLARAWFVLTRAPHLVGTRQQRSRHGAPTLVNALSEDASWPGVRTVRREVLDELAALPEGVTCRPDAVGERLAWRMPLRLSEHVRDAIPAVLAEAEFLGVLGGGALGPAGRALVADAPPEQVVAALDADLPAPVHEVLLQGDLTAIAPGRVEGPLAAFLRLAADLESRGGAAVYRFAEAGVRRCLDAGWSADDVLATLREHSRTPVPQALEYLIGDVARRHGRTRVGAVASYVRSDDPEALETIEARAEFAALRLRRLAPTVLVSSATPAMLLEMLRAHGFAPVAEAPDGGLVTTRRDDHRATVRRRSVGPTWRTTVDEAEATAIVDAARAGDTASARADADGPRLPATDPAVTLALVREAVADRTAVWLGVTDDHGSTDRLLLHPDRVDGGRIHGTVDGSGARRSFSVHRVTGAAAEHDPDPAPRAP